MQASASVCLRRLCFGVAFGLLGVVPAEGVRVPFYARHPQMHTLGNVGVGGQVHACVAPVATTVIDQLAYGGRNVRKFLHEELPDGSVIDLGCGTGKSTPSGGLGVDTSKEMLHVARVLAAASSNNKTFVRGNAETFGEDDQYDVALLFFVLHEAPGDARLRLLHNALRIARVVWVADIAPGYTPSDTMLAGEPYVLSYLRNIEWEVSESARVNNCTLSVAHHATGRVVVFVLARQ